MRLIFIIFGFFLYCNYAEASVCKGAFKKKFMGVSPVMSKWGWNYITDNTRLVGNQNVYERLVIGAAENPACVHTGKCIISDTVCAVKTSIRSLLDETKRVDDPIRLRVVSYGVYFTLVEQVRNDLEGVQTCEQKRERYYMAMKYFWTGALQDMGYRVTDVHPFEVKGRLKPEYLRDDECFHHTDKAKDDILLWGIFVDRHLRDSYRLAWGRPPFGVSWYGSDFFPAFDIEKINK